jgi:hydrogenase nickel incorporation protein HypB
MCQELHSKISLQIHANVMNKNDSLAKQNRQYFSDKGILALNFLSSPGSGKTSLLERTFIDTADYISSAVIVGDLATNNDSQRLQKTGVQSLQILTGNLCHLEAGLVKRALQSLNLEDLDLLAIENVGNLVCPSTFDLGESLRILLLSVTEGEDKPLKYPESFKSANLIILSKIDLVEATGCNKSLALFNIKQVAPQAEILEISSRTGQGMNQWYEFLVKSICQLNAYI